MKQNINYIYKQIQIQTNTKVTFNIYKQIQILNNNEVTKYKYKQIQILQTIQV